MGEMLESCVRAILSRFIEKQYPSIWVYQKGEMIYFDTERPEGACIAYRVDRSELLNKDNTLSDAAVKAFAKEYRLLLEGER